MKFTTVVEITQCTKDQAEKVAADLTEGARITIDDLLGPEAYANAIVKTEIAEV